jgi:fructose-1,6-bisphosphatase/inositol monophosphatase family enzyme
VRLERYGPMTAAVLDLVCRTIVSQMAYEAQRQIDDGIEVVRKPGYDGTIDGDITTNADLIAQSVFTQMYGSLLPCFGVIGEEDGLRIPCDISLTDGRNIWLTVDPLDGTSTLAGIIRDGGQPRPGDLAVMLAVVVEGTPVAAYILDIMSGAWYTLTPGARGVALTIPKQPLVPDVTKLSYAVSLAQGTVLLRGKTDRYSPQLKRLIAAPENGGAFGGTNWTSRSIGLSVMRLLTGEVAAMVRGAGSFFTPWDDAPLVAMCRAADVATFRVMGDGLQECVVGPLDRVTPRDYELLYVPRRYLRELRGFVEVRTLY